MKIGGSCWPNPQQEMLLRAALLSGPAALAAWQRWQAEIDLERLDYGSFRLLPLLYQNLRREGIETAAHPWLPKLKGLYRRTWYQNRLQFYRLAEVLQHLQAAEIPTILLKGAALVPWYYQDYGARVMHDLDVLVPPTQAVAAARVLAGLGFRHASDHAPETVVARSRQWVHAAALADAAGHNLDLHWRVLLASGTDEDCWKDRVSVQLQSVPTATLPPADMLLHVCVHAAQWDLHASLRWIPDALTILQIAPAFDWQRLLAQTEKRHLSLPMRETLAYLHEAFAAPIPAVVLQTLDELPVTRASARAYRDANARPDRRSPWLQVGVLRRQFLNGTHGLSPWPRWRALPQYLQYLAGTDSSWEAASRALYKGVRRSLVLSRNQLPWKRLPLAPPHSPRS